MAKVAINGLGRIGRATLKILLDTPDLELAAINDLVPSDNLAYLLRYDSVYGVYERKVESSGNDLVIDGKRYRVFNEKDPENLPWRDLDIDIVFECSGHFATKEGMEKHLKAGARRVILSTVAKSADIPTIVYGVNYPDASMNLLSCASCTTNSITPVVEILGRRLGIRKAIMTTTHAYTSSQSIIDSPNKKPRRGRAGGINIVPTTTGAAKATTTVLPQFKDKFNGTALRVPVPAGSISDITFLAARPTSAEEVNGILREESATDRYAQSFAVNEDEIVSSDIIMNPKGSIADLTETMVVDGDLVKVMAWYDNEWGFSSQMVRTAAHAAKLAQKVTA